MSTLPPALQRSIEKNAQLAEWRASQKVLNKENEDMKKVAAEKKKAAESGEVVVQFEDGTPLVRLKKDGTPMKKRGPKPKKVKKESDDEPVTIKVEPGISKKQRKAEKEWTDILRNSAEDVLEFVFNVYTRNNDLSDDFLNHLTKVVAKERRERKKRMVREAQSTLTSPILGTN